MRQNGGTEYLTVNEENDYGLDAANTAYNGFTEGTSDASGKWWPVYPSTTTYYSSANADFINCNKHYFTTEHFYTTCWPNNREIRRVVTLGHASYKIKVVMKMVIFALQKWSNGSVTVQASAGTASHSQSYTISTAVAYDGQNYCDDYHSMYLVDPNQLDYFLDTSFELTGISGTTVTFIITGSDDNYNEASYQNWYGITQFDFYEYQCDDACETCDGIDIVDCLTCPAGKYRFFTYTDGFSVNHYRCYTDCPVGYYEDTSGSIDECSACDSRCVECYDSTQDDCTSCDVSNYYLDGNSCKLICTNNCYTCQTTPTEDSTVCLSCDYPHFLSGTSCVATCPAGEYGNMAGYTCDSCPTECATCTDLNTCQSCQPGYYYYSWDNSCVTNCPDNYYENTGTLTCDYCNDNCRTCQTTSTNCQSCLDNYILSGGACYTCDTFTGYISDPNFKGTVTAVSDCLEICGDGIRVSIDYECDDGNNQDGDGCNSKCQIETGWTCSGGSASTADTCTDQNPVRYIITQEQKSYYFENLEQNEKIKFKIQFDQNFIVSSSALENLLQTKIDDVDSSDFTVELTKHDTNSLIYYIYVEPTVNIENKNISFTFTEPTYIADSSGNQIVDKTTEFQIEQYAYYSSSTRSSVTSVAIDHLQLALLLGLVEIKQTLNGVKQVETLKNIFNFFADFGTDQIESDEKKIQVPDQYQKYGYSQLILDNAEGVFFYMLLILIFYCIAKIVFIVVNKTTYFKQNYYQSSLRLYSLKVLFGFFEWSAFNDFWQCTCIVFGVFSMINYYALDWNTSSFLSIFFGFTVLFTPPSIFMVSYINRKDPYKYDKTLRDDYEQVAYKFGYKFRSFWVWLNLERDYNIYYLFLFFLRKLLYVLVFIGLAGWVKVQIYSIVGINSAFLAYFVIKRPYLRLLDNLRVFATEVIMYVALFLTVQMDSDSLTLSEIYDKNQKFITCILVCAIIHVVYIFIDFIYITALLPVYKICFDKKAYRVSNLRQIRGKKESLNEGEFDDIMSNNNFNQDLPDQDQVKLYSDPKQFNQNRQSNRYGFNLGDELKEMESIDDNQSIRSIKQQGGLNHHFTTNNYENIKMNVNSQNDLQSVRQSRARRNNGLSKKTLI
ncbi:Insulin-like growth factor binding protein, N-terminal [Pseudocohnilembus persalinus]|uniref:Insulin-like growth factor binding protein, N-terminal n=1 Tax=Pseudocohnilembus persalinus TaxID=266149 RepID=A0A0V0QCJ0_PSEPJ|nr:Insulin-like growth factor binding protein, N-terminal [Pseudocohnilembus persalinus]|eukprot:KRW99950.1 Insulin-like growth factor binding protein, N-terminal [Pseudocohnilembus persalinus]